MEKLNQPYLVKHTSEQNFLRAIFKGQARGETASVICDRLSGKDKLKSLKLLAKFKALLKEKPDAITNAIDSLKEEGIVVESPYEKKEEVNILSLPVLSRISEVEINSLFLGLCKLVRRLAMEEANFYYEKKIVDGEDSLKRQIKNLELINKGLSAELEKNRKA